MAKTKIAFFEITSDEKKFVKKQFNKNFELFFYKEKLDEENVALIKDEIGRAHV